jgi:glycosyltransferase involved in cell wall biosynthesis
MKIAHIFYSLEFGGVETLLVNISNWQISQNYEVTIILINNNYEESLIEQLGNKINVILLKRNPLSKNPISILKLNFYLIKYNYDILHIHAAAICNFIIPFLNSKRILHIHTTEVTKYYPRANKYIAVSNAVEKMLAKEYKIYNTNVIYNAIKFNNFLKRNTKSVSNKIVSVGRLKVKHKNQDGLIYEFSKIKNQINANLYIIGEGPDKLILKNLITKLDLEDRVFLMGSKSQVWIQSHLHEFDLFIQASHYEGFGITAIEASAACLPLLLSNVGGHIEISDEGRLCEVFDNSKEGELGAKIINFYKHSAKFFKQAELNWSIQNQKFSFEKFNNKIIDIYRSK